MIFWTAIAVCLFIIAFGAYILKRPARGGQAIANFGVGWCAIVFGAICTVLVLVVGAS